MIYTKEKIEKAEKIFKQEGTYLTWLKWKKRKAEGKMAKMMEDLINRHGQNLDGDLDFKHDDTEDVVIE